MASNNDYGNDRQDRASARGEQYPDQTTAVIPAVEDDEKPPSRVPTVIVSLVLGPFGAIAAAISAAKAQDRDFPRGPYWFAFILSWAIQLVVIAGIAVAWMAGAFGAKPTIAGPAPSPTPTSPVVSISMASTPASLPVATVTTTVPAPSAAAPGPAQETGAGNAATNAPGGASSCGNNISVGPNTSCQFGQDVAGAFLRVPGALTSSQPVTVTAMSSATNQQYTMSCTTDASLLVTCTGGNGAVVYYQS